MIPHAIQRRQRRESSNDSHFGQRNELPVRTGEPMSSSNITRKSQATAQPKERCDIAARLHSARLTRFDEGA